MKTSSFTYAIVGTVLSALVAHTLWSWAIAMAYRQADGNRMADITKWNKPLEWNALVTAFYRDTGPDVVFVGSSFTYGYPLAEHVAFTRLPNAVNISMIGADLSGVHDFLLCSLERVEMLVLEIPIVNTTAHKVLPISPCRPISKKSTFRIFFESPHGIGLLHYLYNSHHMDGNAVVTPSKVPDGYFVSDYPKDKYRQQIIEVLERAKHVASNVYVFPSPVFLPGVAEGGQDAAAVKEMIDIAYETCNSVKGVVCLNINPFLYERSNYWNLAHFNAAGHAKLRDWLRKDIQPPH